MLTNASQWIVQGFRRATLPLGCYYAVTLLMPLANGAGQSRAFLDHAVAVASVPLVLVALVTASRACVRLVVAARTAPPYRSAAYVGGAGKRSGDGRATRD
jgi:hypothetical protein